VIAEELQVVGLMRLDQHFEKEAAEETREHAHRQKEGWPARHPARPIRREATARHDHVHMRVD
jgi:hypothetical protein